MSEEKKKEDPAGRRPSISTSTKTDRADRASIITLPDRFAQVTKSHRIIGMESPTDVINPSHIKRRSLKPKTKRDSADEKSVSNASARIKRRRDSTKSQSSNKDEPPQKTPKIKPKTAENIGKIKKGTNNQNSKKKQLAEIPGKNSENPGNSENVENSETEAEADSAPALKYKRPTVLEAMIKIPPKIVLDSTETKPLPQNKPTISTSDKKLVSTAKAAKASGSKSAVVPKVDKSTSATRPPAPPVTVIDRSNEKQVKGQKIERSTSISSQIEANKIKGKDGANDEGGKKGSTGSMSSEKKRKHRYSAGNKDQIELEVQISGYVNVPDFADDIVDIDPYEIHTWVKDMTTKLYLYAVFLVIVTSLLNAVHIFCFHFIPQIFAYDMFYRIFLINEFNYGSSVAVMLSILILAVWICFCLTIPNPTSACVRKGRWFFCVLMELYILWCLISQLYECRNMKGVIEDAMIKDLSMAGVKKVKSPTRLEVVSQRYFECCGINSYEDWRSYGHLNRTIRPDLAGGYPVSCCNSEYPECSTPVTIYLRSVTEHDKIQLWTNSCLQREFYMVVAVLSFAFILQFAAFISSILVCVLLHSVINYTIIHNVGADEVLHPFT